jgi:hypothetical protein
MLVAEGRVSGFVEHGAKRRADTAPIRADTSPGRPDTDDDGDRE